MGGNVRKTKPDTPYAGSWAEQVNKPGFLDGCKPKDLYEDAVTIATGLTYEEAYGRPDPAKGESNGSDKSK